ncbi:hypothetical protein SUGI_0809820 [Cryptomeria japonica]|nr:hypothetical protein SUGI_0809820 [Cryptomeria japonica]
MQGPQHIRQPEPISKPPISIYQFSGLDHTRACQHMKLQNSLFHSKVTTATLTTHPEIHINRQQHTHDCTPCRLQPNIFW